MNYYAIINGINSLLSFGIAVVIFLNKSRKPATVTFGLFAFLVFLWTFFYFMWGLQTELPKSLVWFQLLEYPVCFIHMAYFHFALAFSNNVSKYKKSLLLGYLISVVLAVINSQNGFFDLTYIRNRTPFLYWPHASPLLSLFIGSEVIYVAFSFFILAQSIKTTKEPFKHRLKQFLTINIIGWTGGVTNWFYFYDSTPIPPIGNPAVTFYLLGVFYLIYKHDIFDIKFVIQKTFIYAMLTLFITLIYTTFIVVFERLFQSFFGYSSIIAVILAALTIAILFNPLKEFIVNLLERRFFGKKLIELSSENIQMKIELQKQDQMKAVATLASGMAHEVKNPLTAIKTFTEHLPQKFNDPEFISKFTQVVGPEVEKIDSLVKQLLEFSKPSPLQLEKLNIHHVLSETLELLSGEFIKHNIKLQKSFPDIPEINGDKKQLKQVFLNLFLNSIQAMPNGGTLTVSTSFTRKRELLVSISDTGIGIPKENLPHLFDPFFTTKQDGTGLGLAIVHGIIKEHGGKIEVQSAANQGTCFNILFKTI